MKKLILLTIATTTASVALAATTPYTAQLDSAQVSPPFGGEGDPGGVSTQTASAQMTLDTTVSLMPVLHYTLTFPTLDLDGSRTPGVLDDDVTAIHIHFGAFGANGPHALNIFGFSAGTIREDDADMVVNALNGTITGRWDNSDQTFTGPGGTKQPFDSVGLSAALSDLQGGNLYFQVHTLNYPSGEIRGQILPVPEPGTLALCGMGAVLLWLRSRAG
ncbi:MAG TPA: hypothetical protein DCY13_22200 [Verrucomicrobiales bacterium]|nr:hypothetical protein [Verrucomicrobiales bacterium]